MFLRPFIVIWIIFPYIISFIRDYRRWVFFGPPRILTQEASQKRIEKFTLKIASLGPAFIKLTQVLAMREDIIPKAYTAEFKKLQDQVPAFPYRLVKKIILKELNNHLEEIFKNFEEIPIAAASLGQVHKAIYSGKEVAVKVLRPNVEKIISNDLKIIKFILVIISSIIQSHAIDIFHTIHKEFSKMIKQEMDFIQEAQNAERFRINFKDDDFIIIPKIFNEISSKRVLVLQYHEGIRVDDIDNLKQLNIDPLNLVSNLIRIYTHQVIIDGFLHADPHPGNLLINREGKLIMLDFGMVSEFEEETKLELLKLTIATIRHDIDGVVNGFYKLRMVGDGVNRTTLRDAAEVLMNINFTTEYKPRQIQQIGEDILKTFYRFPLRLPSNLVYLLRASALVEGIGISFDPKFNALRQSAPIVRKLLEKVYLEKEKGVIDLLKNKVLKVFDFFSNLEKVIYRAEREQLKVRAHETDLNEMENFIETVFRRIMIGISAMGIGFLATVYYFTERNKIFLFSGFILAFFIMLIVIILPIRKRIDRP